MSKTKTTTIADEAAIRAAFAKLQEKHNRRKEYNQRPEVLARRKEYAHRPEVVERRKVRQAEKREAEAEVLRAAAALGLTLK